MHLSSKRTPPPYCFFVHRAAWLLGCVTLLGCGGERAAQTVSAPTPIGPVVVVRQLPPVFIEETSRLEYDFPVKNETGQVVRFTGIQRSCSCTAAELGVKELAPGQETTLHFDIDLVHRKGPQRFLCQVILESGDTWAYALETTLYERAKFADNGLTYFSMVDPNTQEVRAAEFQAFAKTVAELPQKIAVEVDSDRVRVERNEAITEVQPDAVCIRRFPLKYHLRTPALPGPGQAAVEVRFERQGVQQQVRTGLSWNVRTLFTISPAQVYFGKVDPASAPVERKVLIRRTDRQPLAIKDIEISCAGVNYRVEQTSDQTKCFLVFRLNQASSTESLFGHALVNTNHPLQPSVKIPLAALPRELK